VPKFYVKWQLDPTQAPANAKERIKAWISMLEMVKADRKAGLVKDWGCAAGGDCGYSINEAESETELFTRLLKWMPYVHFEVTPVLTVDQTIQSIKKASSAMK
jgi:predicted small metal-binding protein